MGGSQRHDASTKGGQAAVRARQSSVRGDAPVSGGPAPLSRGHPQADCLAVDKTRQNPFCQRRTRARFTLRYYPIFTNIARESACDSAAAGGYFASGKIGEVESTSEVFD